MGRWATSHAGLLHPLKPPREFICRQPPNHPHGHHRGPSGGPTASITPGVLPGVLCPTVVAGTTHMVEEDEDVEVDASEAYTLKHAAWNRKFEVPARQRRELEQVWRPLLP